MRTTVCTALLLLALTSCGGGDEGGSARDNDVTTSEPTSTSTEPPAQTPAETPPPTPASTAATVTLQGNAATNPACAVLSLEQVRTASGLDVIGMLGLPADTTNPDKHSESCTWFLDPKVVQSSLVLQYTTYGQRPSDVIAYYPQVVEQGFATTVPDLGTVSKINGHVLDTIHKRTEIHVTLLTHAEATAEDQAATIDLMRIVMAGIKQ